MDENESKYRNGLEFCRPELVHKEYYMVDPFIVDNILHILFQVAHIYKNIPERDKEQSRKILDLFN